MDWKIGDRVAVFHDNELSSIDTIVKLTKTQIVLVKNGKFRTRDGRGSGSDPWHFRHIEPAIDKHFLQIKKSRLVYRCKNSEAWSNYSIDTLQAINDLMDKEEAKNEPI
jgi:hypothetical protein